MTPEDYPRKRQVVVLASALLLLFLVLGALNAFNLGFLTPSTPLQTLIFSALTVLVFLVLLALLVLLLRNILKLYADQRSRVLGSRLRSRMVVAALLLSFAPAVFMFLFSFLLLNRSIDRWFSQPTGLLRDDSTRIAFELSRYTSANARAEAEALAASPAVSGLARDGDLAALRQELRRHRIALQGGFAIVYRDDRPVADLAMPHPQAPLAVRAWLDDEPVTATEPGSDPAAVLLRAAQRSDEPALLLDGNEYSLGAANAGNDVVVVVAMPLPAGLDQTLARIRTGARQYWALFRSRNRIRTTYLLMLLLLTTLVFFTSTWLALYLSKQITRPVEALADAMNAIAGGDYRQRVTVQASEELGELVRSFNAMAADLEESRRAAQTSSEQLSAANRALDGRRRELETILETIPSGVATLSQQGAVLQANAAFAALLGLEDPAAAISRLPEDLLAADCAEDLRRAMRRCQRMGMASTELVLTRAGARRHLAATIASLPFEQGRRGFILAMEDTTEALYSQRQLAWKEVAQRVAHEIKNPLTPIALSAERIRRHIERGSPGAGDVIARSAEVILGSVETLRTLVGQFAALAEFPVAQPRPAHVNTIVESALLLFSGRLEGIALEQRLEADLPAVMADPESLRRALANLIDNAAEAMQSSLLRVLTVETRRAEEAVEIVIADTGPGLTADTRERLFLPFYSTKQRGTGLGLAIAAKIIQEHQGSIRAEQNSPKGARFIVQLPVTEITVPGSPAEIENPPGLASGALHREPR